MSDVKRVVAGTGDYGFEDTVAREKVNELVDTVNTVKNTLDTIAYVEDGVLVIKGGNNE